MNEIKKKLGRSPGFISEQRITPEQKAKVIEALAKSGNNTLAAQHAGIERHAITRECKRDKKFANDVQIARDAYADVLEVIADKRIRDDKDRGSAILLIFRLKALRPEMYRDNQTIKHEGSIKIISGVPRPPSNNSPIIKKSHHKKIPPVIDTPPSLTTPP